jgi:hypothetical protein
LNRCLCVIQKDKSGSENNTEEDEEEREQKERQITNKINN